MAAAASPLIAIVGPTASGKSDLAMAIAVSHDGEILSCDSQQVYRGLDIGTAKPTPEQRARVRHHLLDVVDPDTPFSAAEYARQARSALDEIRARGKLPVVVGGSGLYLRALTAGLFEGPPRDEALRTRFEALARRYGRPRLHRLLGHVDPVASARMAPNDLVRVVRALEVYWATGRPISSQHAEGASRLSGYRLAVFGLAPEREELRRRVEARTEAMWAAGLLAEVEGLLRRFPNTLRPFQAIGYRQALRVLAGESDVPSAQRDMVKATMRYAKRQRTWFTHQAQVAWHATQEGAWASIEAWLVSARTEDRS